MEEVALSRIRQLSAREDWIPWLQLQFHASPKDFWYSVMDYPYPRFLLKAIWLDVSDAYVRHWRLG